MLASPVHGAVPCGTDALQTLVKDPSACPEITLTSAVNEADFPRICTNSNCTRLVAALKALDGSSDCVLASAALKLQSGIVDPIVRYCSTGKKSGGGTAGGASTLIGADAGAEDADSTTATSPAMVKRSNAGLYIGVIVGSVTVLLILLATAAWRRRTRRRNRNKPLEAFVVCDSDVEDCGYGDGGVRDDGGSVAASESRRSSRDRDSYRLDIRVSRTPSARRTHSTRTMSAPPRSSVHSVSFGRVSTTSSTRSSSFSSSSASHARQTQTRTRSNTALNGSGIWDDDALLAARIPRDDVVLETRIARGGYVEVHRGWYKQQQVVAVKMLLRENRRNIRKVKAFLSDAKLLSMLRHPHIVAFIGVAWESLANLCTVSEFMDGGDLRTLLVRYEEIEGRRRGFNPDKARIALHVAQALAYLHSLAPSPVLHRDLKSKNILLSNALDAKLTDVGGVSVEKIDCSLLSGVGTSLWTAPEVVLGKQRYSEKADVFSFGVVLSELDTQLLPYTEAKYGAGYGRDTDDFAAVAMVVVPDTELLQRVARGTLQVQFSDSDDKMPLELAQLGRACVVLEPQARPTAAQVLCRLQRVLGKQVYL